MSYGSGGDIIYRLARVGQQEIIKDPSRSELTLKFLLIFKYITLLIRRLSIERVS